jgi:hypothetical protein
MLFPVWVAMLFGGVATTLLALSAWVTLFGSFTLLVQPRALIAPFRWLRLKAAPVLTLGIILPFAVNLLVSAVAPDQQLHAVQVSNPDPAPDPVGDPVEQRLEDLQSDGCELSLPGVDVRPVFLIAAEGGGIRAAYWTASTLARLEGCAAQSGFVASGISGGSVGLAVASTVDIELREENGGTAGGPKTATRIVEAARETAGPDVVSTAVLGLTVGDLFAAGSGVRVPSYLPADVAADDEGLRWRDRAALVEALWERDAPALTDRFSADISPLTGMLMLSSTDVVSKCRLLVDQVPILARETELARQTEAPSSENGCDTAGGLPSMLGFRELPASGHTHSLSECLGSLDWSTAAMLSARFAIITPTGGLPAGSPCNGAAGAQFVDGGYVEPTSLAALADAAPQLMAAIAEENSERRPGEPWLVPMLLYLRNTQGYDLAADVARAESEPLVPITGGAAKVNLTAEDSWIQRITLAMPEACPDGRKAHDCRAALQALTRRGGLLLGGVVVVAPASTPSVVPPLGWALSGLSQARFTEAIDSAAGCVRSEDAAEHLEESASTRHGQYKGLADLADLSGFDPCDDEWQFAPVTSG